MLGVTTKVVGATGDVSLNFSDVPARVSLNFSEVRPLCGLASVIGNRPKRFGLMFFFLGKKPPF